MFGLEGLAGRIATAVLYGLIVFIVVFIIGVLLASVGQLSEVGSILKQYAPVIGLLAGIVVFFTRATPRV